MDAKTLLLVLALQVAAVAVLYQRFGHTVFGSTCGFESETELLIRSRRVFTKDGVRNATLHLKDGKIVRVIPGKETQLLRSLGHLKLIDYGNDVISPGLIDVHVHFNEPGMDQREGIRAGTRSAAAGGITTVVDMPMPNSPLTDSCQRLKSKIFRYKQEAFVNIGAWGALTPDNFDDEEMLKCMVQEAGAFGFHSNLMEDGSGLKPVNATHLAYIIPILKQMGVTYSVQAQADLEEDKAAGLIVVFLKEEKHMPEQTGFKVHLTHISSMDAMSFIYPAKRAGYPVSVDVAPHFLHFTEKEAKNNTLLKTFPPIGTQKRRKALLTGVREGGLDLVASDHFPTMPKEKHTAFDEAVPGISGLQYMLPVVWTAISSKKTMESDLDLLVSLLSARPAKLLKLENSKGRIAEGFDADFVVWDPEGEANTSKEGCYMTHPDLCPYLNASLKGRVKATWLKGNVIYDSNRGHSWRSCRKIYGLGDWARTTVLWFFDISFAE